MEFPGWLHATAIISLVIAVLCAIIIVIDEIGRHQSMWIMKIVWPLTALFGSVLWLALYWHHGRGQVKGLPAGKHSQNKEASMLVAVSKGASHCGAGCTLGDLIAEWLAFSFPTVSVAFGWQSVFAHKMFAVWILDFLLAFCLGVAFQYFTIVPMRNLSPWAGVVAALKADVISISAWQIGMYGFMLFAQWSWFRPAYGHIAEVNTPEFWLAMQMAMMCGFITAFPVNWLLIKFGFKEKM